MRRAGKINLTCEVVPDGAGVDLFEAGTTGALGSTARIGDEKLRWRSVDGAGGSGGSWREQGEWVASRIRRI